VGESSPRNIIQSFQHRSCNPAQLRREPSSGDQSVNARPFGVHGHLHIVADYV
jgi:hypothetical protein